MSNRWSRHLPLFFTAGLALAAFGCGDDDGGGDRPDARPTADAAGGGDDAGEEPALIRSGTIAVYTARPACLPRITGRLNSAGFILRLRVIFSLRSLINLTLLKVILTGS